ncbi:MAG TPA: SET domain-containing protein [Candidatus Paceibacterota bacterium]|nr:SET domain-containing protein [Candidatus Paceibacterota bacterium]
MTRNIYVAQSSIEGKGVFAKRDFKKGDTVFLFKGRIYKRVNKDQHDTYANPNSIGFGKNLWIDPIGKFPFINHSCNPNMGIRGRVTFVALRDIKKGDELTFDYSIIEADTGWKMKNLEKKGSHFRPVVRSIQFLPLETYKRYLPNIPRYFQKVYTDYHKQHAHG